MMRTLPGLILLSGCFAAPPSPSPVTPSAAMYQKLGAEAVAPYEGMEVRAPEASSPNPLVAPARAQRRDVTPIGYECRPDQPWEFELTTRGDEICLDMTTSTVWEEGRQQAPRPIPAQLRVDGEVSERFQLEPAGMATPFSNCKGTSGSFARQWVAKYRGCLRKAVVSADSQRAELLFPDTSGDEAFVIWRFDQGAATAHGR